MSPFVINFEIPGAEDVDMWAGWVEDIRGPKSLGWAPTLATAARFDTEEIAERYLNSYGPSMREIAAVVEVEA